MLTIKLFFNLNKCTYLQGCLPSDRFTKKYNCFNAGEKLVEGARGCSPSLVVHAVKSRKHVSELIHRGHVGEPKTLSDELHRPLARDEDVLVVELREHLQGRVGHDHLVLRYGDVEPVAQLVRLLLS